MSRSRKPPVMTGPFAQAADDFIQYKRSCGFKYEYEPKCLSRFCRFATDKGVTSVEISRELAEAWIAPRDGESVKSRSHSWLCGLHSSGTTWNQYMLICAVYLYP